MTTNATSEALSHLRVTEVSTGLMASHCGRLFADLGARVQRIDASAGTSLASEPPLRAGESSLLLPFFAHGKETLPLARNTADFPAQLDAILAESDVLIEDSWPGSLFTGDQSPEALLARHPQLVVISLSPFGRTGPYAHWRGGELCAEALGCIAYAQGNTPDEPPTKLAGNPFTVLTAVHGVSAGLAAVHARRRGGPGRVIDLSVAECVASSQEFTTLYTFMGLVWQRCGLASAFFFPINTMECADGLIYVGMPLSEDFQQAYASLTGDASLADDPRLATVMDTYLHAYYVIDRLSAELRNDKREELLERANALRFLCGAVYAPEEVLDNPQLEARAFWREIALPSGGSVVAPGVPIRLLKDSRTDGRAPSREPAAADRSSAAARPLEGVRILDFTHYYAGPTVTRVLAELGADVIRVSSVQNHGRFLYYPLYPEFDPSDEPWNRQGYSTERYLGKREITLDITQPRGRELFEALLAKCDVLVENHSPRALKKLGLTYDALAERFPQLVMLSLSGYGQEGPWGDLPATGDLSEVFCGLAYCTGHRGGVPVRAGMTFVDVASGSLGAAGVLAALEARAESGHGSYLDHSMLEAAVAYFPEGGLGASAKAPYPVRQGNRHATRAPHDYYPCRGDDQWIAIDVDSEAAWEALARSLERTEWLSDARFTSVEARLAHVDELDGLLAEATADQDKAALAERLQRAGVAAAPVNDMRDTLLDPHLHERGLFQRIEHANIGPRIWPRALPGLIYGVDVSIPRPTPFLGEHNEEVLVGLLGVSPDELPALERAQIIGTRPVPMEELARVDPERLAEYPGIREVDPDYRKRLGLDD